MISKILVPTDGSETASQSVKYAAGLAQQLGATITLLSVIDISVILAQPIPAIASPAHLQESVADYMRQAAEACIQRLQESVKKMVFNRKPSFDQDTRWKKLSTRQLNQKLIS